MGGSLHTSKRRGQPERVMLVSVLRSSSGSTLLLNFGDIPTKSRSVNKIGLGFVARPRCDCQHTRNLQPSFTCCSLRVHNNQHRLFWKVSCSLSSS